MVYVTDGEEPYTVSTVDTRHATSVPPHRKKVNCIDITAITQIITSVGFPICMTLILCYYIKYQTDVHKEETSGLTDAINSLKEMISEIKVKLEEKE